MSEVKITDMYGDSVIATRIHSNNRIYVRVQESSGMSTIAVSLTRKQVKELRRGLKALLENAELENFDV